MSVKASILPTPIRQFLLNTVKSAQQSISNNRSAKDWLKDLGFIIFIFSLVLCYMANTHAAQRNMIQAKALESEITQSNWRLMSLRAELMQLSRQTQVSEIAKQQNLHELSSPPYRLKAQSP